MSGPRVTSGAASKQDYCTPPEFMRAVEARYGPIAFDLAAHAGNKQSPNYFAPKEFKEWLELGGDLTINDIANIGLSLQVRGASVRDSSTFTLQALEDNMQARNGAPRTVEYTIPNSDPEASALDALGRDWHRIKGLLWLNCEFNDITTWAAKCAEEAEKGANILLLTPSSTGSNWARDLVFPRASVDFLNGRLAFDGEHPFPKDCMLSHYRPGNPTGRSLCTWDWRLNKTHGTWVAR